MNEPTQHAPLEPRHYDLSEICECGNSDAPQLIADAEARAIAAANSKANVDCLAWSEKYDVAVKRAEAAEAAREDEVIWWNRERDQSAQIDALRGQVAALRETLAELKRNVVEIILPNAKTLTLDIGQVALWDGCVRQVDNALTSTASVPPIPDPSDTLDSRGVAEAERSPVPPTENDPT